MSANPQPGAGTAATDGTAAGGAAAGGAATNGAVAGVPPFLREQLAAAYDETAAAQVLAGYEAARSRPVTLRANTLKASADEVAAALDAAGIAFERVPWYADAFVLPGVRERAVWELPIYQKGRVYLQSLSSMLPALALAPRAGADILDMCAAPGGKTSQICALTGGSAHVTACEMNGPRAEKLAYNLRKLGAGNVNIMRVDARRLDDFFRFDQVLVDAPCTGSGTVRAGDKRAAERITPKILGRVTRSQAQLLDRALTVLKPGGTLVYSTCSVLPAENEEQIERALARHRDCELEPVGATPAGAAGCTALPCRLDGALTVCPDGLYEGFFIALIKKAR